MAGYTKVMNLADSKPAHEAVQAPLVLLDYLQAPLDPPSGAHYQPVLNFWFYHTHPQYLLGLALLTRAGE